MPDAATSRYTQVQAEGWGGGVRGTSARVLLIRVTVTLRITSTFFQYVMLAMTCVVLIRTRVAQHTTNLFTLTVYQFSAYNPHVLLTFATVTLQMTFLFHLPYCSSCILHAFQFSSHQLTVSL